LLDFYEPAGHLTNGSLDRSFAAMFSEDVSRTRVPSVGGAEIDRLCSGGKRVLLKIDVEGAEPEVIQALESIIVSSLPDIVIEVLPGVASDLNEISWLKSYHLLHLTPDGPLERDVFIGAPRGGRDYALVPRREHILHKQSVSHVETHREMADLSVR
jgi:hypothetical protein